MQDRKQGNSSECPVKTSFIKSSPGSPCAFISFRETPRRKRTTKGSWVRFGLQQTPYIDYAEGVYRCRFQSLIIVDRDGFLTSSDFGLSSHLNLPNNYAVAYWFSFGHDVVAALMADT